MKIKVFLPLRRKTIFFFYVFVTYLAISAAALWATPPYQVIGYLATTYVGNSRSAQLLPANIPWSDLTSLYEAFATVNTNGTLSFSPDSAYSTLVTTAHTNGVRVYITIGGEGSESGFGTATNSTYLSTLVSNIMSIVNTYGFDGVDIDWEFPNENNSVPAETTQFTNLMEDLATDLRAQTAFDNKPKGIDFYASPGYNICGYNWSTIWHYSDYAILSGYAYSETVGSYVYDGPVSVPASDTLYNCAGATHNFSIKGEEGELVTSPYDFPVSQMILGCPLYTGNGSTDIYTALSSWTYDTYGSIEMEAVYNGYSVDNQESYCDKINWAVGQVGMPGIALWEISQACPYTDAAVSGVWQAIGGTAGCISLPTATFTPTLTHTSTVTSTQTPTATWTVTSTNTSPPGASTNTSTPTPSMTFTPPGSPNTATPTVTVTSTLTLTNTPTPPPATFTPTSTPTVTQTSTFSPIATSTPSWTSTVPFTQTPTNTPSKGNPVVYPNPVTGGTTWIQVPIQVPTRVTVKIYTLAFREVQDLDEGTVPVGTNLAINLVDKQGVTLANGLYYFVLQAGANRWVDKVLVIR